MAMFNIAMLDYWRVTGITMVLNGVSHISQVYAETLSRNIHLDPDEEQLGRDSG